MRLKGLAKSGTLHYLDRALANIISYFNKRCFGAVAKFVGGLIWNE